MDEASLNNLKVPALRKDTSSDMYFGKIVET